MSDVSTATNSTLAQRVRAKAITLLLLLAAIGLTFLTYLFIHPALVAWMEPDHWATFRLAIHAESAIQALLVLALLARLRQGEPLRTHFQPWPFTTAALCSLAALLVFAAAIAVDAQGFFSHPFSPLNPLEQPRLSGTILGAMVLSAFSEEVWHRGVMLVLFAKLFGNRWIGLLLSTVEFTLLHPIDNVGMVFCGGLLFGLVFLRTGSLICCTALHLTLNLSLSLLFQEDLMITRFLSAAAYASARPWVAVGTLALMPVAWLLGKTNAPPKWGWVAWGRIKGVLAKIAGFTRSVALVYLCGKAISLLATALFGEPAAPDAHLFYLLSGSLQMLAALWLLARFKWIEPLRAFFRVKASTTLILSAAASALILFCAVLVNAAEMAANSFHPIDPFIHPREWTRAVATLVAAAFYEELMFRALLQQLVTRLFANAWIGLLVSAVLFTCMHDPASWSLVLPAGLLFGIVFMRTGSILCTTALHLAMNVVLALLAGNSLTVSAYLGREELIAMRPFIGIALVLLAIAYDCWHRQFHRRPYPWSAKGQGPEEAEA